MAKNRFLPAHTLAFTACAVALLAMPVRADTIQDASLLLKQGQYAQALEQVDKYLSGKPKDAQARFLKGVILTEMNKPNDAIAVFTKLSEDHPELPEPYNNLAVVYAQQRQYEKAKQALEMAIRTHPSYATAHENLGDIYARLASQAYDKALQIDSSNSSAQTKLSSIKDLISINQRSGTTRPATGKPAVPPVTLAEAPKPIEAKPIEVPKPPAVKPAEPVEPKVVATPQTATPAAKPAVATPAKPASAGDATAEVAKAVDGWLAAWSTKDVKAYLAHYAKDFQTPGGQSRAAWESERAKRLNKPGPISVGHENLRVTMDGDTATAKFRQHYRGGSLKTSTNKMVVLVRRDGRWLIQQEKIGS